MVSDFIVDHAIVEEPLKYLEPEPRKLHFDGSSHKNGTDIGILIIPLIRFRRSSNIELMTLSQIMRSSMKL